MQAKSNKKKIENKLTNGNDGIKTTAGLSKKKKQNSGIIENYI